MHRHITNAKTRTRRWEKKAVRRKVKNICHEIELNSNVVNTKEFNEAHENWEYIK